MTTTNRRARLCYCIASAVLLLLIVLIALFVRDRFIRPYGGDVLITVFICCFVRIFFPNKIKLLPLWVFLFAVAVEVGQYFGLVDLIGVGHIRFFRILIGTSFSWTDIICYAVGCGIFCFAKVIFAARK